MNASDTRNKKEIDFLLSDAIQTKAITFSGGCSLKKRIVIMDEVDGMGGSDRGGVAELIKLLKLSKIPIICICNDRSIFFIIIIVFINLKLKNRQSTKIRSLAAHCYDLRVRRPTKMQIANRFEIFHFNSNNN
jgi:replication factor C subunit 1